jgi:3-methyl-2-oxobutanoate hydroxymethyltransferase
LRQITLNHIRKLYEAGEKLVMTTTYDASFAAQAEAAGVEILLVGDSLGMVIQGHDSPLPVSMDHAVYHTECVARGSRNSLVLGDLPFASYHEGVEQAFRNAARLLAVGANMVKLEGGAIMAGTVEYLVRRGIPVCGHIGLTPQSVNALGGFRVQGKTEAAAQQLIDDGVALEQAGASMVVVETVPTAVGKALTEKLGIPTIGIGAGPHCSGQILVSYDLLGIFPGHSARFVRNFMRGAGGVQEAFKAFVAAVKSGEYPAPEHCF